jgi:hypothetical protein
MGGQTFCISARGATAQAAFHAAHSEACHEHGHGGYTGTIAEKSEFVMIPVPADRTGDVWGYAQELIDDGDERIDDKWGPAGCIDQGQGNFVFFGWASS